jgi:hypothetical protein
MRAPLVAVAYQSGFGHTAALADGVHPADVATCRHLGARVAAVTAQLIAGRTVTSAA